MESDRRDTETAGQQWTPHPPPGNNVGRFVLFFILKYFYGMCVCVRERTCRCQQKQGEETDPRETETEQL